MEGVKLDDWESMENRFFFYLFLSFCLAGSDFFSIFSIFSFIDSNTKHDRFPSEHEFEKKRMRGSFISFFLRGEVGGRVGGGDSSGRIGVGA